MPATGPQVDVFHFTSRISSAKIRKYKLATERGMAGGGDIGRAPTPSTRSTRPTPTPSAEPSANGPPAKKAKLLRLNPPRPPSESPDTIAVSRPNQDSLRIRYDENMGVDNYHADDDPSLAKRKPSPAASSDLSSLTSVHSIEKVPLVPKAPTPPPRQAREYSRDFMSYYVTGADAVDDEPELVHKKPKPPEQQPAAKAPAVQAPSSREARFKQRVPQLQTQHLLQQQRLEQQPQPQGPRPQPQPQPHPAVKAQPPTKPQLPQPIVHLVDTIKRSSGPKEPDTVGRMVKKLKALSTALTNFGGVPSVPQSPTKNKQELPETQPTKNKKVAKEKNGDHMDSFLAMFDDGDSDDKADDETPDDETDALSYKLKDAGQADSPLSYGIQFIQNALRSWAQQRITAQAQQAYIQQQEQARKESHTQKRGPGRPRKFDDVDDHPPAPTQPIVVQMKLADTPEGVAIASFQGVLDSGCLQVNSVLPAELSRALRHLYMQIDHLINQGARNEPQWQCMSYYAQIAAHKARVEKWKADQARAQEEMARQQHLAEQQMMQQMGIPHHQRGHMTAEQAQQHHAIELERKRSAQQAAQQPHLKQYLTNPLSLNNQPQNSQPLKPQANGVSTSSPRVNGDKSAGSTRVPHGLPESTSPTDPKFQLDKMKLYMPNFLPRSGQSMKFSFAPSSQIALSVFGAESFPTNHSGPNLPNRGPMSAAPPVAHPQTPNGHWPSPMQAPNGRGPTAQQSRRSVSISDNIDLAMPNGIRRPSQPTPTDTRPATTNGNTTPSPNLNSVPGFKSVNYQRPRSMSSGRANVAASPVEQSIETSNAMHVFAAKPSSPNADRKGGGLASRFPHPGAVVVDQ